MRIPGIAAAALLIAIATHASAESPRLTVTGFTGAEIKAKDPKDPAGNIYRLSRSSVAFPTEAVPVDNEWLRISVRGVETLILRRQAEIREEAVICTPTTSGSGSRTTGGAGAGGGGCVWSGAQR